MSDHKTYARYANSPAQFRAELIVDVDGSARRLGDVMDPWQREDFAAIDPALMRCNGRSKQAAISRAYLERPRGHSKTTDLAVLCAWALAFANRPLRGFVFAADKDQAAILKDAMDTLVRLNTWLADILSVQKNQVVNVAEGHAGIGATLSILASDVGSSFGILPDLIIADELTHWQGDGSLWHSIISSAAKRKSCLLVVIANAGMADSWQWKVREAARSDEAWYFSRLEGPQASWMTEDRLAEQERMLPPIAYARLWLNQWSTGGGDALSPADISRAFRDDLAALHKPKPGWEYVAGLDLGVSRDASAIVILGIRKASAWDAPHDRTDHGKIRMVYSERWKPTKGKKVNLQRIEETLRTLNRRFDFAQVNYDPWQATHMSQRLALLRLRMNEVPPTGGNLQRIASAMIEAFNDRRIELYDDADMRRDLLRLRVEERSYGFRLVSPRDSTGHGDTATALGLALLAATEIAGEPLARIWISGGADTAALGAEWEAKQEAYRREMEFLSQGSADDTQEILRRGLLGLRTY